MSDLMDNQQFQTCHLQKLPLELLEIVFGLLNIKDLPKMLCTSEWINVTHYRSIFFNANSRLHLKGQDTFRN